MKTSKRTAALCAAGALGALAVQAAVTFSTPVAIPGATGAHHPVLDATAQKVAYTSDDHCGLKTIGVDGTGAATVDTRHGAGFNPVFDAAGNLHYRTAVIIDGLMCRSLEKYDASTGNVEQVQAPSRGDISLNRQAGNTAWATACYNTIEVNVDGASHTVSPLADAHSYLWASLSPDGTQLLFTEPFKGVFVSRADGTGARCIAPKGDFAAWVNDNVVTFVVSHDDGYVITDAVLRALDLADGTATDITDPDVKVGESTAANGRVVFTTLDGQMFTSTLNR